MDKNEFKTKYDEIKQLIKEGRTDEALDIVESTNWRKVHNVNALVKASEGWTPPPAWPVCWIRD